MCVAEDGFSILKSMLKLINQHHLPMKRNPVESFWLSSISKSQTIYIWLFVSIKQQHQCENFHQKITEMQKFIVNNKEKH